MPHASISSQPTPLHCRTLVYDRQSAQTGSVPNGTYSCSDGQFRLFFFSREEPRMHVHVAHPDGEAKFWLSPEVVLANHTGLSNRQLNEAQIIVERHVKEIQDAWNHHFGS